MKSRCDCGPLKLLYCYLKTARDNIFVEDTLVKDCIHDAKYNVHASWNRCFFPFLSPSMLSVMFMNPDVVIFL